MRKIIFFCLILFLGSNIYAQISINRSDYYEAGDEIRRVVHDISSTGPVLIDNFLTESPTFENLDAIASEEDTLEILSASSIDIYNSFPDANIAIYDKSMGISFYNITDRNVELIGLKAPEIDILNFLEGIPLDMTLNSPITLHTFPLTFGSSRDRSSYGEYKINIEDFREAFTQLGVGEELYNYISGLVDTVKIQIHISILTDIDEFGNMNINGTNLASREFPYLREKRTVKIEPDILFRMKSTGTYMSLSGLGINTSSLSTTITNYFYWVKNEKYPLVEASVNEETNEVLSLSIRHKDGLFYEYDDGGETGCELPSLLGNIAYPNPAVNYIKFNIENYNDCILNIYSINGELIDNTLINSETTDINISNYNSGNYIYKICNKNGVSIAGGKFIKQ